MGFTLQPTIYFARSGATIDGDTVSKTYKPDIDPVENWTQFPYVTQATFPAPPRDGRVMAPVAGQVHPVAHYPQPVRDFSFTFGVKGMDLFAWESLLGTSEITASSAFLPMGRTLAAHYWLKVQTYNQANQRVLAADLWGTLQVQSDVNIGGEGTDPIEVTFQFNYEYAPDQTADITNAIYG